MVTVLVIESLSITQKPQELQVVTLYNVKTLHNIYLS